MCVMLNYNMKTRDKTTRIKERRKKKGKGETKKKKFLVATIATWYFNFSLCDDPMYGKNQKGGRDRK